jgi:hypothetical protein
MAKQITESMDCEIVDVVLTAADGEEKHWRLVEVSAKERNRYLDKLKDRVVIGKDGQSARLKNFDGFEADLLVLSLRDEDNKPVPKDVIEALPARLQKRLFTNAQELSGLAKDDDKGDASKND